MLPTASSIASENSQSGSGECGVSPATKLRISRPRSSIPSGSGPSVKPFARMWRRSAWMVGVHGPVVRRTVSPARTTMFMWPPGSGTSASGPSAMRRHRATWWRRSDLEPRLLEVELVLDAAHDLARDLLAVAQPDERAALRGEDLVHQALVEQRALLEVLLVLDLARADLEPPLAELVQAAHALDRPVARPLLLGQLVDALERGTGDHEPRAQLLALLLVAVVDRAEAADQPWERQPLPDDGHEDQRERHELDHVAARERVAGVGLQGQCERRRQRHRAPHPRPAAHDAR